MSASAWINEIDLEDLGIRVESILNARSLTQREWPIRPLPGVGQVMLTDDPTPSHRAASS